MPALHKNIDELKRIACLGIPHLAAYAVLKALRLGQGRNCRNRKKQSQESLFEGEA
jgi:hypothetical protein